MAKLMLAMINNGDYDTSTRKRLPAKRGRKGSRTLMEIANLNHSFKKRKRFPKSERMMKYD